MSDTLLAGWTGGAVPAVPRVGARAVGAGTSVRSAPPPRVYLGSTRASPGPAARANGAATCGSPRCTADQGRCRGIGGGTLRATYRPAGDRDLGAGGGGVACWRILWRSLRAYAAIDSASRRAKGERRRCGCGRSSNHAPNRRSRKGGRKRCRKGPESGWGVSLPALKTGV